MRVDTSALIPQDLSMPERLRRIADLIEEETLAARSCVLVLACEHAVIVNRHGLSPLETIGLLALAQRGI